MANSRMVKNYGDFAFKQIYLKWGTQVKLVLFAEFFFLRDRTLDRQIQVDKNNIKSPISQQFLCKSGTCITIKKVCTEV